MSETASKNFNGVTPNGSKELRGRRISGEIRSPLEKSDVVASPLEMDDSEDARRLRTFSFPCVSTGDYQPQSIDRRRSTNNGGSYGPELLMNMEKSFHMEESQSEALFNRLKTYAIGENKESDSKYSKLKSKFWSHSRKSSQDSPRLSLISLQRRSSVFSTNVPSDSSGSSRPSLSSVGSINRKTSHKRSRESVSFPIQIQASSARGTEDPGSSELSISIQDPNQCCEKQFTVSRAELDEISKNTEEQIRRNSTGNYSSLIEFANKTGTQTKGHVFAHCAEHDKSDGPIIVLDGGVWDLESSASSNDVVDRKSMDSTVSSVGPLNSGFDLTNSSKYTRFSAVLDEEDECEDDAPVEKDKYVEVLADE